MQTKGQDGPCLETQGQPQQAGEGGQWQAGRDTLGLAQCPHTSPQCLHQGPGLAAKKLRQQRRPCVLAPTGHPGPPTQRPTFHRTPGPWPTTRLSLVPGSQEALGTRGQLLDRDMPRDAGQDPGLPAPRVHSASPSV